MCLKAGGVVSILILVLLFSASTFAAKKSSIETYLEELHNQGKERVIVRFKDQIDPNLVTQYHGKVIRQLKIINAIVCEINQSDIELLRQEKAVKHVVPDAVIRIPEPKRVPEEPIDKQQEPEDLIIPTAYDGNATVRWNNLEAGLNSQAAWDNYDLDGTGIKIAFLDTGVNYNMENLDDNYLGGYDFASDPDDDDPINNTPEEKHGTEVVSLAVGEGVNKVVGVAYNVGYYAVKTIDGDPPTGLLSDVIAGIEWSSTEPHKADIISMSFGIYDEDQAGNPLWPLLKQDFEDTCDSAYNAGIILVAASGNRVYDYSSYPAAFTNVISVGGHASNQSLYSSSNGGVDIITPGARVYTVHPDNSAWWVWGTSFATPHASALIALQLQYARQNDINLNNGYNWEVMKHSAHHLAGETYDPVYQGEGKIYAAQTDVNDANIGSIDLIASNWPVDYDFNFSDYAFIDSNCPVYQIGEDVNQTITLTNITDILGNTIETIEDLDVVATQVYYGDPNDQNLPGNSVEIFPTVSLLEPNDANSIALSLLYTIPPETTPGLVRTALELEFNFVGNSRVIRVSYNNDSDSLWYAAIPADLDLSNTVSLSDFSIFAEQWQQTDCNKPDWCGRADMDQSGVVDWLDMDILAENWLTGL